MLPPNVASRLYVMAIYYQSRNFHNLQNGAGKNLPKRKLLTTLKYGEYEHSVRGAFNCYQHKRYHKIGCQNY
jgi:hypothetical protein